MSKIDAYTQHNNYMRFQHKRPDYNKAISASLQLAKKYAGNSKIIADFCCGTGSNTKKFSNMNDGLQKAILIDINEGFLDIAKKSNIKSNELIIYNDDVLNVNLKKECSVIFSIFAYHHIQNKYKMSYVNKIKKTLKKGGILILTEIFFDDKKQCSKYYKNLYENIPANSRIRGLKDFLKQTAESDDFEFKVSKQFADHQFKKAGFKLKEEIKIWPKKEKSNLGTFVQVYSC